MTTKKTSRAATKPPRKGADVTPTPAATGTSPSPFTLDARLPAVGATIEREYKGKTLKATVRADGFEYEGKTYRSLSALAREVTGAKSINGYLFWQVGQPAQPAAKAGAATTGRPAKGRKAKTGGAQREAR